MEKQIEVNKDLVAICGLYCGACQKYIKGACQGCLKNEKATWCKTRACCLSKGYSSCADCSEDVNECKKFTNFVSKLFGFLFNSDRNACIKRIESIGREEYAMEMAEKRAQTIKRK